MMLLHGLRVVTEDDNVYGVYDCNRRLGGIVRYWLPVEPHPSCVRRFRAPWGDHDTLPDAVASFLTVRGCKPCNALGDCEG